MAATNTGKIRINNGKNNKYVLPSELGYYLNNGWVKGTAGSLPCWVPCKVCGKLINRFDGKTGICAQCLKDTGYYKKIGNDPILKQKRIENATGKKRSQEFKDK